MATTSEFRKLFKQAGEKVLRSFEATGTPSSGQVTPPQLVDAMNQFFAIFEKLDGDQSQRDLIAPDEITQMAEHAAGCLMDLGVWAERLQLPQEKAALDQVALGVALWTIRHHGKIGILEPLVNALAAKANTTADRESLTALFHVMHDVIEHVSPSIKSDLEKSDPTRPWRILNLNFAIVATRTQNRELMTSAFDVLGRNLPEDCPGFFEEGLNQVENMGFGPEIKAMMKEYFMKWTTRH